MVKLHICVSQMALGLNRIIPDFSGLPWLKDTQDSSLKVWGLLQRIFLPSKVLLSIREVENWARENQLGTWSSHENTVFWKHRHKFHGFVTFFAVTKCYLPFLRSLGLPEAAPWGSGSGSEGFFPPRRQIHCSGSKNGVPWDHPSW